MRWDQAAKREATIRAALGTHLLRADSQVIERPGWYQIVTPSCPYGSLNEVILSELSGAEVERVIDDTILVYRRHGLSFKWCVGPWSKPADLGERLTRRGFSSWDVRGMACDTALHIEPVAGASVELVTESTLDDYLSTMVVGWDVSADEIEPLREVCRAQLGLGKLEMFLVRHEGECAGTAGHAIKDDGSAYLIGGNVLESHRGRGLYRALLRTRLSRQRERGIELATTHARESSSAPILERLGFETMFRYAVYQLSA